MPMGESQAGDQTPLMKALCQMDPASPSTTTSSLLRPGEATKTGDDETEPPRDCQPLQRPESSSRLLYQRPYSTPRTRRWRVRYIDAHAGSAVVSLCERVTSD